ncbi:ferredoxin domain-containing protein [Chakrabartyella piscis]|uniref:ferredoxin domain-containing protein n=1 Tax=Chakrabartyella piscis TaxID=2918914 RepID=UPI0029588ECC|nr:DUF2148 domain-containing protein [Chakrabartyella piscis]
MKYTEEQIHLEAIETVAKLMVAAGKTAPKGSGIDSMEAMILDGADKDALAAEMRRLGTLNEQEFFIRDAGNLEACPMIVLFGAQETYRGISHCGYCGTQNCGEAAKTGAHCAFSVGDLGIAIGSAVSVAANHHIDNRIMYSAGKAALSLGLFSDKVFMVYGIPLSVSAKSPFFDRKPSAPTASVK